MSHYPIQTNLTAGELSPRMALRVDFEKYQNGAETLENFITYPQGGITRAPGLRYVATTKDSTKASCLIPFEFNTTQAYMIEAGDLYFRFYRDGGQIESSPGVPLEVVTPYLEADLFDLKYAQSADTLYIVHPSYPPRKLTRTSHTAWALNVVTFIDGPYLDANLVTPHGTRSTATITPSAATGNITLTASSAIFASTDVGRIVRMLEGAVWGYAQITLFTSTTLVNASVLSTLTNTNAKADWHLGAWSTTTGYPGAITFFEERLAFGGSTAQPQTIWLSVTSDYEDMTPGTADSDALNYTIAANQVNVIKWLASSVGLLIGTVGGEFAMFGGNDSPLTPTNVTVRRQSTRGSLGVQPVQVGNATLFVQRAGRKIRQLEFSAEAGSYKSPDLTLLAEHITDPFIVQMSYQQEPDSIIWAVIDDDDGTLVAFTYNPEQEVLSFARRITDGRFESVATIPHPDQTGDQTWVIVRRTIDGVGKRFVEYMDPALFVDSGLTYEGALTTTITGLDHLATETVDIVSTTLDEPISYAVYPQALVSAAGGVLLDGPETTLAQVGLHYTPRLVTLRPEVKMHNGGTSQGRKKRWVEVFARLYQSLGLTINGDTIPFRKANDPMGLPPPLFTGDKRITVSGGWSREGQLTITQDQPLPVTILGYFGTLDVGENGE